MLELSEVHGRLSLAEGPLPWMPPFLGTLHASAADSPVVALTPKYKSSSPIEVSMRSGPPARLLFHKIPSATVAGLPFWRSNAVVPSWPNSNQQASYVLSDPPQEVAHDSNFHSSSFLEGAAIRSDHAVNQMISSLRDYICDPPVIVCKMLHDSTKHFSASSLSDFKMVSTNPNPIAQSHTMILLKTCSPVNFLGTTVLKKLSSYYLSLSLSVALSLSRTRAPACFFLSRLP